MNRQETMEKVQELMQNDQFKEKLANAESLDEMASYFQDEGIQVTGADLDAASEQFANGEELTEENLENVSGGGLIGAAIIIFIGGSMVLGIIDGVKKRWKKCNP